MASLKLRLVPFNVPEFVTVQVPTFGKREDWFQANPKIPLSELDSEALEEMIQEFALAVRSAHHGPKMPKVRVREPMSGDIMDRELMDPKHPLR